MVCRSVRFLVIASSALAALAFCRTARALEPFSFANARPARLDEVPPIPIPEEGPLSYQEADSLIQAISGGEKYPETRYQIFDVDLDADGDQEQVVQLARVAQPGIFSRAWWGVYEGGRLDQMLFWNRGIERAAVEKLRVPMSFPNAADSLTFVTSVPEWFPATDVVEYGDLTGDGKSEIVIWMLGATRQMRMGTGVFAPLILSPTPEGLREVFRTYALYVRCTALDPNGTREYVRKALRLHVRQRKSSPACDIVMEPFVPSVSPDTLCKRLGLDERDLPRDPDEYMPLKRIAPDAKIPGDWFISRWDGSKFGPFKFARDVKLD
ncbi:MAG: hypothetical protein FJY88_02205 [Candidatus Eisenbacteria bacterium]|nr:hypothetical protein [Candidatus Eisenbacteria bacterium]